jgi:hypothetical protein
MNIPQRVILAIALLIFLLVTCSMAATERATVLQFLGAWFVLGVVTSGLLMIAAPRRR